MKSDLWIGLRSLIRDEIDDRLRWALPIGIGNGILSAFSLYSVIRICSKLVLVPKLCRFHLPVIRVRMMGVEFM